MKTIIWKIWIGDKPIPEHFKQYTDTWSIIDAEIKEVTNKTIQNYLTFEFDRVIERFKGNNTVINHWLRYYLMYRFGGIYLDLDVEVLKDSELWYSENPIFFFETVNPYWLNNHILVCKTPNNHIYYKLANNTWRHDLSDPRIEINTGPGLITRILGKENTTFQCFFPEFTTPWNWNEKPDRSRITENTIAVHHFTHSWKK